MFIQLVAIDFPPKANGHMASDFELGDLDANFVGIFVPLDEFGGMGRSACQQEDVVKSTYKN